MYIVLVEKLLVIGGVPLVVKPVGCPIGKAGPRPYRRIPARMVLWYVRWWCCGRSPKTHSGTGAEQDLVQGRVVVHGIDVHPVGIIYSSGFKLMSTSSGMISTTP